ncbi:MAG: type II toxin-antitoxin system HicB family antitoxin [Pseudomonadales bacterium]|nr:type II toxin-antitoxin system HicB family antitoxin [Pseudomonadales bacterium]
MKYMVVIEKTENNFSAHVPDLPGCVATADTKEALISSIREAIAFHIEGMQNAGEAIPGPTTDVEFVEVSAA